MTSQDSLFDATQAALRADGIFIERNHLPRVGLVEEIIGLAQTRQYVVLGSPPATGKTSTLQLIKRQLRQSGTDKKVLQIPLNTSMSISVVKERLAKIGITEFEEDMEEIPETWLLFDDAQNWYGQDYWPFWQFLVKHLPDTSAGRVFIIIAATHDLSTPESPVHFGALARVNETAICQAEVEELCGLYFQTQDFDFFLSTLKNLSLISAGKYHIGVIIQGISLLEQMRKQPGQALNDDAAVNALRSGDFVTNLKRCFAVPDNLPAAGRSHIVDAILRPTSANAFDNEVLQPYTRAGILNRHGIFSCLAARWFYNKNCFPNRASMPPHSLDELVRLSIQTLSASRLQHCLDDGFPKEAAFQHFFNEAMSVHLTTSNYLIPELNTWATNSKGEEISGELDFYIDNQLQWCIELLRNGDKIGEHLKRFDEHSGKYREVVANDYLMVDCRPSKTKGVSPNQHRCTLYFEENFTKCRVQMRTEEEVILDLQP